jgi:prolyl-tRNA synthetase
MRWEMRPRLFLRTAEFLWQEGHTAHETRDEAIVETRMIHQLYQDFLRDHLAIPVIPGEKTENERFPGADMTLTIEAMVQDKKAIQAGTSHYLGQNFSRAQNISFAGRDGTQEFAHTTSWGVSTRLIGTLIMAHSDDDGLVLPPRVATKQVVIIPVTPKEDTREAVLAACHALAETLRSTKTYHGDPLRVHVDARDIQSGQKKWEWVKKGAPIRIEIGPRDIESRKVCLQRRDQAPTEKSFMDKEEFIRMVPDLLQQVHDHLFANALKFRNENISACNDAEAFHAHWSKENPGWILTPWAGSSEQEDQLSKQHKITIRCLPITEAGLSADLLQKVAAHCFLTGKPRETIAMWGRSY